MQTTTTTTTTAAAAPATTKAARLTLANVRADLAAIGVTIRANDWNEYRVNLKGADSEAACFIDRGHDRDDQQDALEEALATGRDMAQRARLSPVATKAILDAARAANPSPAAPRAYRLGSSGMVYAPGIVAYAINGFAFKKDRPQMIKLIADCWSIPAEAATALLSKAAPYTIEGETVVFTA